MPVPRRAGRRMNVEASWAYFVLMAVVVAVMASPLWRFVDDATQAPAHRVSIDGLRGFLALGVFVYHVVVTHRFVATGVWAPPDSRFYRLLGPVGVSVFFMLTGYLFWTKLLRARGSPRWSALYIGRLFRIVPMYLFVVLVMLLIVFARTGFELHEPAGRVAWSVLQWLAFGLIDTQADVNGEAAAHVLAGVTWTIWYEWVFYASLPALAAIARRRAHLAIVLAGLSACLAVKWLGGVDAAGFAALFACGMTVASLLHEERVPRLSGRVASSLALLCLVVIFSSADSGYGTASSLLLAVFFYLVCAGASVFGLLDMPAAQRLGRISYSLYLMQGLVLTLVLAIAPVRSVAMASAVNYWAVAIGCAGVLLLCAALGYVGIERPGIALGRRLVRGAGPRRSRQFSAP